MNKLLGFPVILALATCVWTAFAYRSLIDIYEVARPGTLLSYQAHGQSLSACLNWGVEEWNAVSSTRRLLDARRQLLGLLNIRSGGAEGLEDMERSRAQRWCRWAHELKLHWTADLTQSVRISTGE